MVARYLLVRVVDGRPLLVCKREDLPAVRNEVPNCLPLDDLEQRLIDEAGLHSSEEPIIIQMKSTFPNAILRRIQCLRRPKDQS